MWRWIKLNIIKPISNFFSSIFMPALGASKRSDTYRARPPNFRRKNKKKRAALAKEILTSATAKAAVLDKGKTKTIKKILALSKEKFTKPPKEDVPDKDPIKITDLPKDIFARAMPEARVPDKEVSAILGALSSTCREMHGLFNKELADRAIIKKIWQAAIDDDVDTVIKKSKERPDLLFRLLTQGMPKGFSIQSSKYTSHNLDLEGENLFTATVKRKQVRMIKTLLICCKLFDKNESDKHAVEKVIKSAFTQWTHYLTTITYTMGGLVYQLGSRRHI